MSAQWYWDKDEGQLFSSLSARLHRALRADLLETAARQAHWSMLLSGPSVLVNTHYNFRRDSLSTVLTFVCWILKTLLHLK